MNFPEIFACLLIAFILYLLIKLSRNKKQTTAADQTLSNDDIERDIDSYIGDVRYTILTEETDENITHTVVNWDELKSHYLQLAKKHKRNLESKVEECKFIFLFQIILCSLFLFQEEFNELTFVYILSVIIVIASASLYLFALSKTIKKELKKDSYIKVQRTQLSTIWSMCDELLGKMNLGTYNLEIYYIRTNDFEAHVYLDDEIDSNEKTIYLFLSRAVISHSSTEPKVVESILGHEFGHVVQGDSKMLLANRDLLVLPGVFAVISIILLCIFFIWEWIKTGTLPAVQYPGFSVIIATTFLGLRAKRQNAELLADLASIVFVEKSVLLTFIDKYFPENGDANYPSKNERIINIQNTINAFTVTQKINTIAQEKLPANDFVKIE